MQESRLERRLEREVKRLGGIAAKWVSPGLAGVPDRILLFPGGRIIFVEMKAPGKPLRVLQAKRRQQLTNLGFKAIKIDSDQQIDDLIREVTGNEV
ncbi:VRR-NUC domain-containing protein [Sporolactobacillus shoreicorticis]|uniref:VRR-NUC domain-containing protein n=1 Tax=Sporolactobacillus shoreicorticis TaxID=1923877 RepID=A0ABW5S0D4_9BACL|nr:VRR-NUC domain-containing protein [Sporolactobacillus shoreicorticis]MCO7125097.1 VRR-NUC domain-containing protein [Sporolactobacillus shoreicorticis]